MEALNQGPVSYRWARVKTRSVWVHTHTHTYRKIMKHTGIHPHAYKLGTHTIHRPFTDTHLNIYAHTSKDIHVHIYMHKTCTCTYLQRHIYPHKIITQRHALIHYVHVPQTYMFSFTHMLYIIHEHIYTDSNFLDGRGGESGF